MSPPDIAARASSSVTTVCEHCEATCRHAINFVVCNILANCPVPMTRYNAGYCASRRKLELYLIIYVPLIVTLIKIELWCYGSFLKIIILWLMKIRTCKKNSSTASTIVHIRFLRNKTLIVYIIIESEKFLENKIRISIFNTIKVIGTSTLLSV